MPDNSVEAWQRLGLLVRQRRAMLMFDQGDAKERSRGRIARATWSNIERGIPGNYSEDTLLGLAEALDWTPESIDAVLEGGQPTALAPIDSIRARVDRAALDPGFAEKVGRLSPEDRRYIEGIIDGMLRDTE